MKDELTDCLKKISKCDVLFLGSPIYIGAITELCTHFWNDYFSLHWLMMLDMVQFFQGKCSLAASIH